VVSAPPSRIASQVHASCDSLAEQAVAALLSIENGDLIEALKEVKADLVDRALLLVPVFVD
jgi:hypothetical protein